MPDHVRGRRSARVRGARAGASGRGRGDLGAPGGGFVSEERVKGRAAAVIWPVSRWGGLGLPDRDYYTGDREDHQKARANYLSHIAKMFVLAGADEASAKAAAAQDSEASPEEQTELNKRAESAAAKAKEAKAIAAARRRLHAQCTRASRN